MNFLIRKILVPVDLSEASLNALETAAAIAKKHHAVLQILNVSEPVFMNESGIQKKGKRDYPDVLNALTAAIHNIDNIQSNLLQKTGNVVETILTTASSEKSDLIIMGTHGASAFRDGFIGSNTYNVIKYSSCSVLTIPSKRKFISFDNVLFPIRAVNGALEYYNIVCHFLLAGATLQVFGLSSLKIERKTSVLDRIVDEIRDQLNTDRVKTRVSWGDGNSISEDIIQFANQENSDLIVLTSIIDAIKKRNYIGPHTQRVINICKVPLLCIKINAVSSFA